MASSGKFELRVSEDDPNVAYLKLPGHPGTVPGVVRRSLDLREVFPEYVGPDVYLDLSAKGELIGIEVVG
jgi:uncharacterized protein YuzE